jgi:small-conductance mechanosensitive channel
MDPTTPAEVPAEVPAVPGAVPVNPLNPDLVNPLNKEIANQLNPEIVNATTGLIEQGRAFIKALLVPEQFYQVAALVAILLLAMALRRFLSARLMGWARAQEGLRTWQLRIIVSINLKMTLVIFTAMAWVTFAVAEYVGWPPHIQLIGLTASIGTTLVMVNFAAQLIGNNFMSKFVSWTLGIWVVASTLGFGDGLLSFLDSLALSAGDIRLSALTVIKAMMVTGLLVLGARFLTRTGTARIKGNADISPSMQVLAIKGLQLIMFGGAIFIGLKAVGFDLTGLAVLSGAIGVGLGFGLQKVVSNLVSGIIILLDKSVKPGDVISLGDTFGWIESLGARYVSVVTRDGKEYLIPNEDLITGQVVNWSHSDEFVRLDLFFGTAYGDDPHAVRKLAVEAAQGVTRVLTDRPAVCHIVGFGDSSVDYILRFWIKDPTAGLTNIKGNVYLALWDTFKANNISIPFPQREVKVLNAPSDAVAGLVADVAVGAGSQ